MSQLRKQKEKKEKIMKRLIKSAAVLVIFGFLALGIIFLYQEFFAPKPPEAFVPSNPTSFISINLKQKPDQDEVLKELGKRLGDENFFENTIKGFIFPNLNEEELEIPEEEKIKSWLGEKIGIGHIYVSPTVSLSVFILELKNSDLAKKFLQTFSANLEKQGNVVTSEQFRNGEITKITGQTQLSYAINQGYLLISQRPDGVKKMIDTREGRFSSLKESRDYYLTKKKIKTKSALAFAYLDTFEFLKILYQATTGLQDKEIFNKLETLKGEKYLGLSLVPKRDGIKISGFIKKEQGENHRFKKIKTFFDKKIPKDIVVSFEGKNLKPFFESLLTGEKGLKEEEMAKKELFFRALELETGLNLEEDLFSLFEGRYVFALFPSQNTLEGGLISEVKGKPDLLKKLGKVEEATVNLLNKYLVKEENKKVNFTEHSFGLTKYRYLNLPDKYQIDISYALVSDYLILATSSNSLEKLLTSLNSQPTETLSQNPSYQNSFTQLNKKESHQVVFLDVQNLLKFINRYIRFDYEKLDKKVKTLNTLIIIHEDKSSGSFFESFLEIK